MSIMLDSTAQFIKEWLATPRDERDIPAGAEVMLSLNRNKILYGNIIGRPDRLHDKLEYELKKYYRIYLDHQTAVSIVKMEDKLMPEVEQTFKQDAYEEINDKEDPNKINWNFVDEHPQSSFAGLRDDHNELPEKIRSLYQQNGDIYFKMKALHNKLKTMSNAQPCDRYEHLKILDELYKQYRENWNKYDNFDASKDTEEEAETEKVVDAAQLAKDFSAARKFISTNSKKLEEAVANKNDKVIAKLMTKIQDRIDFLVENNQTFDADYQQKLVSLGMSF